MSIYSFPRCAGYLKAMRVRLDDPDMTDYWFAAILSEGFTDEELTKAGTIDFSRMTGDELLSAFEQMLVDKRSAHPKLPKHDMESLKAFFGSRGVKASRLQSDDDFWICAGLMWGGVVKRSDGAPLSELLFQLRHMSKSQRRRADIRRVPAKWRSQ